MKTITQNSRKFFAAVAAVGFACATIVAHADETANGVPARTVRYSDLNLNTQTGAATLYRRIHIAAELVCGDVGLRPLAQVAVAKACVDRAVFSSVRAANNPRLTKEYNAHIGAAQQPISLVSDR